MTSNFEFDASFQKENDIKSVKDCKMTVNLEQLIVEFEKDYKELISILPSLSKNQMRRIIHCVAAHPLRHDRDIKLVDEFEEKVFNLLVQIRSCKFNMLFSELQRQYLSKQNTKNPTEGVDNEK